MPKDSEIYDLTIIGAGPTGLFGAFYAGLREMRTKIIEALPEPGGQLAVLYPEKFIYDVPGHPKVLAKDLVRLLIEQTALFPPEYVYGERVETLTRKEVEGEEVWRVGSVTSAHYSRTVMITAGIGAFEPNRLDRPGIADFEGDGVYYFVKDKRPFRGKRVLIIGGGDTAVDWALNLKDWASHITLIHRRDQFRAHESSLAALRAAEIPMMVFWEVKRVLGGESGKGGRGSGPDLQKGRESAVKGATIYNNKTGEEQDVDADIILVNIGFKAALGAIATWGLQMDGPRHIKTNGMMETNLPGVYVAGDIAAVDGSVPLNLIVTGFAHAAIAANAAKNHIDPKARIFPGHSSEMKLG